MRIDIWSDIVCPWCYIGKRRFERALAEFPHRDAVTVSYRAFQLTAGTGLVRNALSVTMNGMLATFDAYYPGYIDYMPVFQNIPSWWTETQGGNCATPNALRACAPRSPNTSPKSSLQPLVTKC